MKALVRVVIAVGLGLVLMSCVPLAGGPKRHATGRITGKVVDYRGQPVSDAEVWAIYIRRWTTVYPPVPNHFLVARTKSSSDGTFTIDTKKRVDKLEARYGSWKSGTRASAEIVEIEQSGNVLRLDKSRRDKEQEQERGGTRAE